MAFKDLLTQALTTGKVKVGEMTEKKDGPTIGSRFAEKYETDKGLASALMNKTVFKENKKPAGKLEE